MSLDLLLWFIIFAIVMYVFDRLITKWINKKDCPDVYSETGVEDEIDSNSIDDKH